MTDSSPMNLLGAIDYKDQSELVVQHTIELASKFGAAEAHFLHVSPAAPEDVGAGARNSAALLEWLGMELKAIRGVPAQLRIIGHEAYGDPATVIVHTARELSADLIIVGNHGRSGVERLLGNSVTEAVMRHAETPVLVVRPKWHEQPSVQLEPACPMCVEARVQSGGAELWCDQHREKHGRRHTYYDNHSQAWSTKPWFLDGVNERE
jgi:nucleotide-binding universal stress UspA family protein